MHLEHKNGVYYQEKIIYDPLFTSFITYNHLPVYNKIHDYLISLPLNDYDRDSINQILSVLKNIIK